MKATFVKRLNGFVGHALLFKVEPPTEYEKWLYEQGSKTDTRHTEYVMVSAAAPMGQPETYIFPADAEGEVLDWGELPGSFKGGLDHEQALRNAGYEIA